MKTVPPTTSLPLSSKPPNSSIVDYPSLRSQGLALLQHLTGDRWTDHNEHDPGITILEQVCYALTDLSYRAGFSVVDLLAEEGREAWPDTFSPRRMLHSGPVSLSDWRKLLLDLPRVANARILPVDTRVEDLDPNVYLDRTMRTIRLDSPQHYQQVEPLNLQGLYRIDYVLEEPADPTTETAREQEVTAAIRACFHAHRNLGEDLHEIRRIVEVPISVVAKVEIGAVAHPEELLAEIYDRIRLYFSPSIRFYSLQEQLAKGHSLTDSMDSPMLDHGYLDEAELADFHIRHSLRISDLIRLIMDLEGVHAVRLLQLQDEKGELLASTQEGEAWEWSMEPHQAGSLAILDNLMSSTAPGITFWQEGNKFAVDWDDTREGILERIESEDPHRHRKNEEELDQLPPLGRDREVSSYQSILDQFPDLYGIGQNGLPATSSPQRRAQAKQLQAYLAFFDQLLANEFSQLAAFRSFFDLDQSLPVDSYFSQSLIGKAPGFEAIADSAAYPLSLQNMETHAAKDRRRRRNRQKRLVHHLLARFGERFTDFITAQSGDLSHERAFLRDYPHLSYRRFAAFDYSQPAWNNANVAGLEVRLHQMLGMGPLDQGPLSDLSDVDLGGLHLVEHLLLRPTRGDGFQQSPLLLLPFNGEENHPPLEDPYSLQISFVLPGWLNRFQETHDKEGISQTIRSQCPAHLRIYLHWLGQAEMTAFENAYRLWLHQIPRYQR